MYRHPPGVSGSRHTTTSHCCWSNLVSYFARGPHVSRFSTSRLDIAKTSASLTSPLFGILSDAADLLAGPSPSRWLLQPINISAVQIVSKSFMNEKSSRITSRLSERPFKLADQKTERGKILNPEYSTCRDQPTSRASPLRINDLLSAGCHTRRGYLTVMPPGRATISPS